MAAKPGFQVEASQYDIAAAKAQCHEVRFAAAELHCLGLRNWQIVYNALKTKLPA